MAKKLLGERQVGDMVYEAGQIFSDEEAAATGLPASDFVGASSNDVAAVAEATPAAATDADADADVQADAAANADAEEKNQEQQSASTGDEVVSTASDTVGEGNGAASVEGAEGGSEELTIEHTLTGQDLLDDPSLVEAGHKEGDIVRVAAVYKELTQDDLDADAALVAAGHVVGDKILVAAPDEA